MLFHELLDRAIELVRQHGRVSYRALKVQLGLTDDELYAIRDELVYAKRIARDEDERVLIYSGDTDAARITESIQPSHLPLSEISERLPDVRALKGERKHVTVMFADIRGSTELIRDMDPEDARHILVSALQVMKDSAHRYEGTVNDLQGDGLVALFGAPIADEDHALHACRAAFDMQRDMQRLSNELYTEKGISIGIGIGLNTGDVVVGTTQNDFNWEYVAYGKTTHVAARLQGLAGAGCTVMSAATARLVEGFVEMRPLDPFRIKGLAEPVAVFELLGITSESRRLDVRITRGLTRFVGRETETATVKSVAAEAKRGEGQVVAIVGEPGVGKSRLVHEILSSDVSRGWTVLQSSSVSYGKVKAYFPVIDLLRRYFQFDDNALPTDIAVRVTGRLRELDPSLDEAISPILSLLEALPPEDPFADLGPRERHHATLEALKRLLLSESRRQPLMLVFEDLHCIDNGTQAFLDSLVEALPTAPLLLLVDYRTQYRHPWSYKTYYNPLPLRRLSPDLAQQLLLDVLGNDESLDELKALLVERTEGNPFFLEESVRTLCEMGVLTGAKGAYRLARSPQRIEIPETVQAVLSARIDRLVPEQKELLQTAAVIGTRVPHTLLRMISGLDELELERHLRGLLEAEFVYETEISPERIFTFKHALTNEVAYESLLKEKRRILHARIVAVLEEFAGGSADEQAERIAPHAMLGEIWDKAAAYFWKSGKRAMARSAFNEARVCFENALQAMERLSPTPENQKQTIDLRLDLRNAMFMLGNFDRVYEHLEKAESLATALNDEERICRTLNFMSSYFTMRGEANRALECGNRALLLRHAQEDIAAHTVTHYYLGIADHYLGKYAEAAEHNRTAIAPLDGALKYERFGTSAVVSVMCRNWMVQSLAELGEFEEGIERGREGIQLAQQSKHLYSLTYVTCSLGFLYFLKGEPENAIPLLEECLTYCKKGMPLFPHVAGFLGGSYTLTRRLTDAIDLLEEADRQTSRSGRLAGHASRLTRLGEAYFRSGNVQKARSLAERAVEVASQHGERGNQAWAERLRYRTLAEEDPEQAEIRYRDLLITAQTLGMRPLEAHCLRCLGMTHVRREHAVEAKNALSRAIELYRRMGINFWLRESEALLESVSR